MKAAKTRKLTEEELESGVFRHEVKVTFSFLVDREGAVGGSAAGQFAACGTTTT